MYKPLFFILALCLAFPGLALAQSSPSQTEPHSHIGLLWGFQHSQAQDLVYSPMVYQGQTLLALQLFYHRRSAKGMHAVRVSFDQTSVEGSDLHTFPFFNRFIERQASTSSSLHLSYTYGRELIKRGKTHLLLGGLLDNQLHALEYNYAESSDIGYLLAYALGVWLRGEYQIDDTQYIHAEASFPVLSFVTRPPYAIVDNKNIQSSKSAFFQIHERGTFNILSGLIQPNVQVAYNRSLSDRFLATFAYTFTYTRATEPLPLSVIQNRFSAGLAFSL